MQATEESRRNVLVTLLADVARSYTEVRGAQQQLAILDRTLLSERDSRDLARPRTLMNATLRRRRATEPIAHPMVARALESGLANFALTFRSALAPHTSCKGISNGKPPFDHLSVLEIFRVERCAFRF